MANVNVGINGRNFAIHCEDGQEQRVTDLGHYIDARLREIAKAGAANNEAHLLVLTSLMLADEVFDLRDELRHLERHLRGMEQHQSSDQLNEVQIAEAIDVLAKRIDNVSERIKAA
ncbi:MAG: hypothetical protein CBB87_07495 [Micavibrio sp. TMED27]|nr:cell division protein ZapA [Micavibrio sp.]OUT90966.1 MAG: hypothetical protein CBB87_07495 [Micavibrio sp. TMED27]|tara:strand:- start:3268 stop:3615 length:348 start_codon:yes stop_codon:yes gene_type:complete